MNRKNIVVTVAPDGSIKVDAQGFKGAECEKATKFLRDALGAVSSVTKKPEYVHATSSASATARQ